MHNVERHESEITHAKSSKPPGMFQWDFVDTSPDLAGQNVRKTFEMAGRHSRRTTRTELERVFRRWIYFHSRSKKYFLALLRGWGGAIARIAPHGSVTVPRYSVAMSVNEREDGDV